MRRERLAGKMKNPISEIYNIFVSVQVVNICPMLAAAGISVKVFEYFINVF